MNPGNVRRRFEGLIASLGVPLASLTPQAGLDLILRFYGDDPAGATLLCFWGPVSRYGEEELGFDFQWYYTRFDTFEPAAPSDFSLLFKIGPPAVAGDLRGVMAWCAGAEQIATFRSSIEASDAFKAWGHSPAAAVLLLWDDISTSAHALFDCWGVRDPSRPVLSMTEEQWLQSGDVSLMLRWFRQEWRGEEADLNRLLQRYLLACCRRIWRLLPMEKSRRGIEITERYIKGTATREEFAEAEWHAEGAAFYVDTCDKNTEFEDPMEKEAWIRYEAERRAHNKLLVKQLEAIPPPGTRRDDPLAEARGRPVATRLAGACGLLC
jgi:hypothetical protein